MNLNQIKKKKTKIFKIIVIQHLLLPLAYWLINVLVFKLVLGEIDGVACLVSLIVLNLISLGILMTRYLDGHLDI